jgi:hypothetical protein
VIDKKTRKSFNKFDNNSCIGNNSGDKLSTFLSLLRLPFLRPFAFTFTFFDFFTRFFFRALIAAFSASLRTVCLAHSGYAFLSATSTNEKTKNSKPLTT